MIGVYMRISRTTVFVFPALAMGIGPEWWIEIAWLGIAFGVAVL